MSIILCPALRRRAGAYLRRQNLDAKRVEALQRVLNFQRLIHNWVRPHWSLGKKTPQLRRWATVFVHFQLRDSLPFKGFTPSPFKEPVPTEEDYRGRNGESPIGDRREEKWPSLDSRFIYRQERIVRYLSSTA